MLRPTQIYQVQHHHFQRGRSMLWCVVRDGLRDCRTDDPDPLAGDAPIAERRPDAVKFVEIRAKVTGLGLLMVVKNKDYRISSKRWAPR